MGRRMKRSKRKSYSNSGKSRSGKRISGKRTRRVRRKNTRNRKRTYKRRNIMGGAGAGAAGAARIGADPAKPTQESIKAGNHGYPYICKIKPDAELKLRVMGWEGTAPYRQTVYSEVPYKLYLKELPDHRIFMIKDEMDRVSPDAERKWTLMTEDGMTASGTDLLVGRSSIEKFIKLKPDMFTLKSVSGAAASTGFATFNTWVFDPTLVKIN